MISNVSGTIKNLAVNNVQSLHDEYAPESEDGRLFEYFRIIKGFGLILRREIILGPKVRNVGFLSLN